VFNDVFSDVSYAGFAMRGEILGAERRRFWHEDDKLSIVLSVGVLAPLIARISEDIMASDRLDAPSRQIALQSPAG